MASDIFAETLIEGDKGATSSVFARPVKIERTGGDEIADGSITAKKLAEGVLPEAATADKAGLVKKAAVTSVVAAVDATAAAGDAPTKAEFDAVVTLVNAVKQSLNGVINAQRAADQAEGNKG